MDRLFPRLADVLCRLYPGQSPYEEQECYKSALKASEEVNQATKLCLDSPRQPAYLGLAPPKEALIALFTWTVCTLIACYSNSAQVYMTIAAAFSAAVKYSNTCSQLARYK
jgi:hypothetical protein